MSDWITDRRPTAKDADDEYVWVTTDYGHVLQQRWDQVGQRPWLPRARPEPYVKPKRWTVREYFGRYYVVASHDYDTIKGFGLPTREAAERIAAIYEEVMP